MELNSFRLLYQAAANQRLNFSLEAVKCDEAMLNSKMTLKFLDQLDAPSIDNFLLALRDKDKKTAATSNTTLLGNIVNTLPPCNDTKDDESIVPVQKKEATLVLEIPLLLATRKRKLLPQDHCGALLETANKQLFIRYAIPSRFAIRACYIVEENTI